MAINVGTSPNIVFTGTSTGTTSTASTAWYNTTTGVISTSNSNSSSVIDITSYDTKSLVQGEAEVFADSSLKMPDGTVIDVDSSGNFKIEDKDAKVIYKSNSIREFNRYMNASDLLEAFIGDLGKANIKQGEVLAIPIEMFINWIIHKSAEQDGDDIPQDIPSLEDHRYKHPRCKCCGKYIRKDLFAKGLRFCDGSHYQKYLEKNS